MRPPSVAEPADIVSARRWYWRLSGRVPYESVQRVRVDALRAGAPALREFVLPFDRLTPAPDARRWQRAGRAWLFHCVAHWADAWPSPVVGGAVAADMNLLAHQFRPVLALRDGRACRLLLADAVGSGKTIEAALILAELAARRVADRVLVLTPATLRDQWQGELSRRTAITAQVMDRVALRNRSAGIPADVSPWCAPGAHIMSADLAKQPDVLAGLCTLCWDTVIVDEAHGVAGDSARTAAVRAIAARARVLLLLSATPYAGDDVAFTRLCSLGRHQGEAPLMVFATDRGAGHGLRHRDVRARPSPEERQCLRALTRYVVALEHCRTPGARLLALVLRKRALSSPHALLCSLRHRQSCLRGSVEGEQVWLPFDDTGEQQQDDVDQPPVLAAAGFADVRRECAVLEPLIASATAACMRWSKRDVLRRLIRRTGERVLIFTEYRDTLAMLSTELSTDASLAVLHGGLDRAARADALARFTSGAARVMVATDVAAEGLNLQHACRLVVHVELPWSPARLEQRNGRVNRLGQTRCVHVWRLLGQRGLEARIVRALAARLRRMRDSGFLPSAVPLPRECRAIAAVAAAGTLRPDTAVAADRGDDAAVIETTTRVRRLHAHASRSVARARKAGMARRVEARHDPRRHAVRWIRVRRVAGGVPPGIVCVFLARPAGVGCRQSLVPVHVALTALPAGSPSDWLPPLVTRAGMAVAYEKEEQLRDALRQREAALLAGAISERDREARAWQPSLFDRRAARLAAAATDAACARVADHQRRLDELTARPGLPPVPVLVLVVQ